MCGEFDQSLWDYLAFEFVQAGYVQPTEYCCPECGGQLLEIVDCECLQCIVCDVQYKVDQ
jgi:hypothetical protein